MDIHQSMWVFQITIYMKPNLINEISQSFLLTIRLRIKHIREEEDKDHFDSIDLVYIYNEDEDEDPILEWLQENRQPALDEEQGRLNSRIATEMSINVEEYILVVEEYIS